MKKINLLPSFSIAQQKEIAQWHRYTVIVLCLLFVSAAIFQIMYLMHAHTLQKDIALLRKKVQPHDSSIKALQQTKQDIAHLQNQIVEFKKIAQQTTMRIDIASKIIVQGIPIRSFTMHDNDLELSLMLPNSTGGEHVLEQIRSLLPLASLQITSVQSNTKGEMSIVLQGKIA
jgi:Tfp pilus assembly protein PilN